MASRLRLKTGTPPSSSGFECSYCGSRGKRIRGSSHDRAIASLLGQQWRARGWGGVRSGRRGGPGAAPGRGRCRRARRARARGS